MSPLRSPQTSVLQAGASAGGGWRPCLLTWYDPALGGTNSASGKPDPHSGTASGEPYDPNKFTCAAPPSYSFGTMLTFRYQNRQVTCRVNDRGGAITGAHFDLSRIAASNLGMLSAGAVQASFMVGGNASSAAGGQAGAGGGGGDFSAGSILTILKDIITLDVGDLAGRLAVMGVAIVKDIGEGVNNYLLRPAWHWNQRAVMYYEQNILFGRDPQPQMWTAVFWSFGYWLLWTDADSKSLKPVPVRRSRIARAVRGAQSVPARASLIKPKNVREKTPKKPKATLSTIAVSQVGTLATERKETVKTHGSIGDQRIGEGVPVKREGTVRSGAKEAREAEVHSAHALPNEAHRTGDDSSSGRGRNSEVNARESAGSRIVTRHRRPIHG